jgi:uncharacterized protein (DUF427 family)
MAVMDRQPHYDYAGFAAGPLVEKSPRWVRVRFGGETIADSKNALLLRLYGPDNLPTYYFPQSDVRMDLLTEGTDQGESDGKQYHTVVAGQRRAENGAWTYVSPPADLADLQGHVSFEWDAMDSWFEEEEQIFVHARDPYKRVDVIASSRHVRVELDGQTVAETERPFLLFETGLPTRYYIPRQDVRMELLVPSDLGTQCPYKGVASYWSVKSGEGKRENIAWSYPNPIPENPKLRELICFFNERVDLYVDGERQVPPTTPWSE